MAFQQIGLDQENISPQNTRDTTNPLLKGTELPVAARQPPYLNSQTSVKYQALSIYEQQIRLLLLDDHHGINAIREGRRVIASSSLVSASLNDNIEYIALSYPWGSGEEREYILVNGFAQPIGSNLAAAIRYIDAQRQGQPAYLWVDKLCINQDDLDEKAWQIHDMSKKIYSRASKTLVWLGTDYAPAGDTFEVLSSLENLDHGEFLGQMKRLEDPEGMHHGDPLVYIDPDCRLPTADAAPLVAKWARLRSIFSLPWWGRRWVIQEAFFSQVPLVCLAAASNNTTQFSEISHSFAGIHMDKLAQVAIWHAEYMSTNPDSPHEIIKSLFRDCPFYPLLQLWIPFRTGHSIHQDLPTWIRLTTSFKQTLDRDIVFALLPLSSANDQHTIYPDYRSPDSVLFTKIFSYLVHHPNSAGLLQPFLLSTTPRTFALPSWCEAYWPSRSQHPSIPFGVSQLILNSPRRQGGNFVTTGSGPFKASGEKKRVTTFSPLTSPFSSKALLSARGVQFDEIGYVLPIDAAPTAAHDGALRMAVETCRYILLKHFANTDPYRDSETSCSERLIAICMALLGGNTGDIPTNESWRQFKNWLRGAHSTAHDRRAGGHQSHLSASSLFQGGLKRARNTPNVRRKGYLDFGVTKRGSSGDGKAEVGGLDPFFERARLWCHNRSLVITSRGYLGLAPVTTEVGDHVAIIYGEDVPAVIRRSRAEERGGALIQSLIGAAYVHGIMQGEALVGKVETDEVDFLFK